MAGTVYRRDYEDNFVGIMTQRRALLNRDQSIHGKSAQMRDPCWVKITGTSKTCTNKGAKMVLPRVKETHQSTYDPSLKPAPDLDSVTLEYGGQHGLSRKLTATITCYKMADFLEVQNCFLLPGNIVDVEFGRSHSWSVDSGGYYRGFTVATFSFSATSDGKWVCTFEAVSASTALKNLDIQSTVCNGCNPIAGVLKTSGPIKFFTGKDRTLNDVKGVAHLIAADSQLNGTVSIEENPDGYVITKFVDYNPDTPDNKKAAIVIYNGDHMRKASGGGGSSWMWLMTSLNSKPETSEVETSNNQVYVTLGYIVHRIIDDQLLRGLTCNVAHERDEFNKIKIVFDPDYSTCVIPFGIHSGDPLSVLMLGNNGGNYLNGKGNGKDFDKDCKNLSEVKCIDGKNVALHNILVHRTVVASAIAKATSERKAEADNTDIKDVKAEVVNIMDFFKYISDAVNAATGGAIALRLIEHPKKINTLVVIDQNCGYGEKLPCIVLDPIDGDGSTRSCQIQSNVGSSEYRAAMFVGSSKKGDAVSALRGCKDILHNKANQNYLRAVDDRKKLLYNPGNVGENAFNGEDLNALKAVISRISKNNPDSATNETVNFPGLSLSAEIDGTWGIIPGNAISSTQVPPDWRDKFKSYFMVTSVVHTFQQSDWKTNIDGILAYYPKLKPIML